MRQLKPVLLLLWACATPAFAQTTPSLRDVVHARTWAMGGAYRAMGLGADIVGGNPAALPLLRRYQLELSGSYDLPSRFGFASAAIVDSVTSQLAAGVQYGFVSLGQGADHGFAHTTTLGIGMPVGDIIHLGVSGKYINGSGAHKANAITADAGLLLKFSSLAISFTGHNLIDIRNPDLQRYFALSAGWVANSFAVGIDGKADFGSTNKPQFGLAVGGEYIAGGVFPLRAGYSMDPLSRANFISFGLGYLSEGSGVDLAYRHELGGANGKVLSLTLKMQM